MEELEQTQGTEQVETDQTEARETQPTVDELRQEIDRKEKVIQNLRKDIKGLQRQGGSKADIEALGKRLDSQEEFLAQALDDLAGRLGGEYEEKPQRRSYREELENRRKSQPKEEVDPAAQRFFDYLTDEGLDFDDDMVQETIKDTKTPQEALKVMKAKVKEMNQQEVEKLAEKKADEKLQAALEAKLKEMGLTTTGSNTPSGSSGRSFTRQQIKDMSIEEYKERKKEIDEAIRQGRIRD